MAIFALAIGVATVSAALAQVVTVAPLTCDEDRSTGEPPTISSRFDLKGGEPSGTAFTEAKDRASHWCASQGCTINGQSIERKASIYALAALYRRYIAGFRCVAPEPARPTQAVPASDLTFRFGDPGEIDTALAKANGRCALSQSKAELADLRKREGAVVAVFTCGP